MASQHPEIKNPNYDLQSLMVNATWRLVTQWVSKMEYLEKSVKSSEPFEFSHIMTKESYIFVKILCQ